MKRSMVLALAVLLAIGVFAVPGVASAVPTVSLSLSGQSTFNDGSGHWYASGLVINQSGSRVTDAIVTLTYKNSGGTAIGTESIPVPMHVVNSGNNTPFEWPINPPTATVTTDWSATGVPTTVFQTLTDITPIPSYIDQVTSRNYAGTFTNTTGHSVAGVFVFAYERDASSFYCGIVDTGLVRDVIAAGATPAFDALARRMPAISGLHAESMLWEAEAYTPASVWRFYNFRTGTHFYTADPAEMAHVRDAMASTYHLDGVGYTLNTTAVSNYRPLYRFYNKRTGTHFYTADEAEKNNVVNTLGWLYQYDGPAYNVSAYPWFGLPVYRFYNRRTGTHFYTADETEKANVINTLGAIYSYEGPAYYLAY
jgi:Repeat of unknown function (DUF5648)